jgi:NAD(P)-dependent dehydrogenase (short-subunit alcohol dehydrogenase family)
MVRPASRLASSFSGEFERPQPRFRPRRFRGVACRLIGPLLTGTMLPKLWFAPHLAYSLAKYGMSLCVLGMAEEFREAGIAVNRTIIATAALNLLGGEAAVRLARKVEIVGDAAHAVLIQPSRSLTGRFLIDEEVLARAGVTDFSPYLVVPGAEPLPDFFLP